jgi:alkylhydroperoxidase/carboxymuconolactone decarboxylase family protein YurZ
VTALSLEAASTVTVAALTAAGRFDALHDTAMGLIRRGAKAADLREAAYLVSLFCGFPKGVAALAVLAEIETKEGDPAYHHDARPAAPRKLGKELFHEIHRANAERQLDMLQRIHPDFADTVIREAYGRVLSRNFLPLKHRELCGVAALVVLGLTPQLRAHLLGAHNTGATWPEVEAAVALAGELGGADVAEAQEMVTELRAKD